MWVLPWPALGTRSASGRPGQAGTVVRKLFAAIDREAGGGKGTKRTERTRVRDRKREEGWREIIQLCDRGVSRCV